MFSFRALNEHVTSNTSFNEESSDHLTEDSCITDCSLLSACEKLDDGKRVNASSRGLPEKNTSVPTTNEPDATAHITLSPNVLDLLHPSKKNTRECEEVRVIKLYRHALRLCSTDNPSDERSATPLLESIVGSFLLRSHDLPNQLNAIKFATCKLLGGIYMKSKQNKKAMKFLIKAIELDRSDLTLWLRLARVAIRSAKFTTATTALDHILTEHPSHPVALPLALLVYLAVSEFEICLELANRALKLDPLNERAVYCVQYILQLQPNLFPLIEDALQFSPDLLTEPIADCTKKQLDEEFQTLRGHFREQLDAQAESRKIETIEFPERLSSLTWTHLMDACVKMFDQLLEESMIRSVLDLTSLLPEELIQDQLEEEQATVSSPELAANPTPMSVDTADGQEVEETGCSQPSCVMTDQSELPQPHNFSSEPNTASIENATSSTGVSSEAPEKRRSSRVRPDMDLTDGLNRYRSRRAFSINTDNRTDIKSPGRVSQPKDTKPKPLNRLRCAEQIRGLLPTIVRELAMVCDKETVNTVLTPSQSAVTLTSLESKTEPCDELENQYSYLWSSDAVTELLKTLHPMQPNIVTFGIALLLQVSQLYGDVWPSQLCELYVSLSERLRSSLPRWLLTPSEYREMLAANDNGSTDKLLPDAVLELRAPPSLTVLTRFHLVYVELRLEQLEAILSPNSLPVSLDCQPKDPRSDPTERFLSNSTVMTLVDVLSLHDPGTSGFSAAHAHYLWINYLLGCLVQDYTEMEGYLVVLKEHLLQNNTSIPRNYSAYHGSLSLDHINQLLNQLTGVSEFERLCRLSSENKHGQIAIEITSILEQRRMAHLAPQSQLIQPGNSNYSLQNGTCGHVRDTDLLSLLDSSLERLLEQWDIATKKPVKDTPEVEPVASELPTDHQVESDARSQTPELQSCYKAAVLLLESVLWSHNQKSGDKLHELCEGQQDRSHLVDIKLQALTTSAIRLLVRFWELLASELSSHSTNPLSSTVAADQTDNLTLVSKYPLRFHILIEEMDEPEAVEVNPPLPLKFWPTVGEACRAVCTCLDLLATQVEAISLGTPVIEQLLTPRFITFVFEHLVCIEQSIPSSLLPHPLRMYYDSSPDWVDQISDELLMDLYSGHAAAPPSLAWLHWAHELLSQRITKGDVGSHCRQHRDLLTLLRQLVWRTANQLKSIVSKIGDKAPNVSFNQFISMCSSHSETDSSSPTAASLTDSVRPVCSDEEFAQPPTTNDDDTVACVQDLVRSNYQPWPLDCISLNRILAQAILCLVPCSLLRQLDVSNAGPSGSYSRRFRASNSCDRPDANGSEDETSPDPSGTMGPRESAISESNSICVTPMWVQQVNRLLIERNWCSHMGLLCSIHPAWWQSQATGLPGSVSDEIKLLDWNCIQTVFEFCHPTRIPDYDSVKTLSVSNELLNLLQAAIGLLPSSESDRMLTPVQVEQMMQNKAKNAAGLPEEPTGLSSLTKVAFYLIADHYMKNNNFELAIKYYLEDLRACPRRSSTWAALGLIYYSDLEQIINLTNLKTERVSPDAVSRCLRCFSVAISLLPWSVTLFIERGCLAYQLHAYAARVVKKASTRSYPEAHLNLCRKWRSTMLHLARQCYQHVLDMREIDPSAMKYDSQVGTSLVGPVCSAVNETDRPIQPEDGAKHAEQAKDEEWLCRYMLAKCSEKEAVLAIQDRDDVHGIACFLLSILEQYHQALQALDAAGAKYPKKVILYHKLPFRAVEAIEVYYRIHALAIKTLLHYGPPDPDVCKPKADQIPLVELRQFLIVLQSSEFVASCGKPRRGKKRTGNSVGLSGKPPPAKQMAPTTELEAPAPDIAARSEQVSSTAEHSDVANDALSPQPVATDPMMKQVSTGLSSQEEFIDLTSPEPPTPDEDAPISGDSSDPIQRNPLLLWTDCVDRCRVALELVLQRLPLHYKAMYRLADIYLRAPHLRDPLKALSILLGPVNDSYKSTIGGLFKDRKQNNFFHGVWRIPTSDIDRSGNFAAHMYRSVSLTLDTLSERGDWRHLVHIFHQLRKQPPEDKRGFLGEGDRVYLARRAFNLIQPTLFIWLNQLSHSLSDSLQNLLAATATSGHSADSSTAMHTLIQRDSSQSVSFITLETLTQIYRLHCVSYSRNCIPGTSPRPTNKESPLAANQGVASLAAVEVSGYAEVLQLAYRLCPSAWDARGPDVDLSCILQRCLDLTSSRSPGSGNTPPNRPESGRSTSGQVK